MREIEFSDKEGIPHFPTRVDAMRAILPPGSVGAELGVMRGNHSQNILLQVKPSRLFLVDPWFGQDARCNNVTTRFSEDSRVKVVRMDAIRAAGSLPALDWYVEDTANGFGVMYDNICRYDSLLKFGGFAMFDYCDRTSIRESIRGRYAALKKCTLDHGNYVCVGVADDKKSVIFKKIRVDKNPATREEMYGSIPRRGAGLEIGVMVGENAAELLDKTNPSSLLLIDCWDEGFTHYDSNLKIVGAARAPGESSSDAAFRSVQQRFAGDKRVSVVRNYFSVVSQSIADKSLDWAYIDGDHRYEAVLSDLRAVLPKMKDKCVVAGHDWTYVKYYGVINAVLLFLKENPAFRLVGISGERWSKSFMLKRG
jgi:hypothetical protein